MDCARPACAITTVKEKETSKTYFKRVEDCSVGNRWCLVEQAQIMRVNCAGNFTQKEILLLSFNHFGCQFQWLHYVENRPGWIVSDLGR